MVESCCRVRRFKVGVLAKTTAYATADIVVEATSSDRAKALALALARNQQAKQTWSHTAPEIKDNGMYVDAWEELSPNET